MRAGIGRPYALSTDEWACPVALTGLQDTLHDVHGASSLQAMCLAASLLRRLLTAFVDDGGSLRHPADGGVFDIAACFSGVGVANGESA